MAELEDSDRQSLITELSAAFLAEIPLHDAKASTRWQQWPTVADLIEHVGNIYAWASVIVSTGASVDRTTLPGPSNGATADWFAHTRSELLAALAGVPTLRSCWTLATPDGETGFWLRRMVLETAKHLTDLRAAGNDLPMEPLAELPPAAAADGIDELFEVFLARSRASLDPLPGSLVLCASESSRRWHVSPTWQISDAAIADAELTASTGDLLLFVWERADPFALSDRFTVDGDAAIVRAFDAAPIHP